MHENVKPPWRYRFLVRLLSPLLIGYTIWRTYKDGGLRYLKQRLGLYEPTNPSGNEQLDNLWVHAASVGEVFTVLPLVKSWLEQSVNRRVLLTTGTPTAALVLEKQSLLAVRHQYLPIDFPGACKRFLQQAGVRQAWIVETEIWPWLYSHCHAMNISITIVNGRLSSKTSTQATGLLATSYRRALSKVRVLARSEVDQERFLALGAVPENVRVTGNLKYAANGMVRATQSFLQQPYVLAASTHNDEELRIATAWLAARKDNTLLVIAPRHPERGSSIHQQLSVNAVRASLRSAGQLPKPGDDVYIADTLGELQAWYQFSIATFVGGSLIKRGGHNMLEPARFACPTIVGPHTANFDDMMSIMQANDAIAIADTASDVAHFFASAAAGRKKHKAMGQRALQVAEDSERTMERYLEQLMDQPVISDVPTLGQPDT